MNFEFATATRIIFGSGEFKNAGRLAAGLGRRALVTTGLDPERSQTILDALGEAGLASTLYPVSGEPTLDLVLDGVDIARTFGCDMIIGFGGGSAIDAGKALSALLANPGEALDYLEVVGKGLPLPNLPLPFMAVPTTAGTGSEVTRNAVIGVPERQVKVSLRSPHMLAKVALVDPELTYSLPREVTAASGLDALTQLIEPFTCNKPNPLIDALCRDGIVRGAKALPRVYHNGLDVAAREDMSLVSLYGGLALANAKLGAVHGFAAVIGGMYRAAHGAVCARLLPYVVERNAAAMRLREPHHPVLERYREVARLLTGRLEATVEDGVAWLHALVRELNIPALGLYGMQPADLQEVVAKSAKASSMQGNPIKLTDEEMETILTRALSE